MRVLAQAIAVLAVAPVWAASGSLDSASLYVSAPLKWERSPRPGQPAQRFAHGRILAVNPDGDLVTISCLLYKAPDNQLHIMYTEGYSLSSGTWRKTDGHLAVRLRSIHSSVPVVGAVNQQDKEESWAYAPAHKGERLAELIKIGDTRYVALENLSGADKLAEVVQFHRREAENPK